MSCAQSSILKMRFCCSVILGNDLNNNESEYFGFVFCYTVIPHTNLFFYNVQYKKKKKYSPLL